MHLARLRVVGSVGLVAALNGCGGSDSAAPSGPRTLALGSTGSTTGTVGIELSEAPTFVVRDAAGNPISGVPVTVAVVAGGGQLVGSPAVSASTPQSIGRWTLGTHAGPNTVRITTANATPLEIVVTGEPGALARLGVVSGDRQTGRAGIILSTPLEIAALDAFDNPIPGIAITVQADAGNGSFSPATATTMASGRTPSIYWTLGTNRGQQVGRALSGSTSVQFSATTEADFHPTVRYIGDTFFGTFADPVNDAVAAAVRRLELLITADVPDVVVSNFNASSCGLSNHVVSETVDDLLILFELRNIDGIGGVFMRAGPCLTREGSGLPAVATIELDRFDAATLISTGTLATTLMHEFIHALGFGSLWQQSGFVAQGSLYTGAQGLAACRALSLAPRCAAGVPVLAATSRGPTFHWNEDPFDTELMSSEYEPSSVPMPLSALTIAALADLGYAVDRQRAEPYLQRRRGGSLAAVANWEHVLEPRLRVTSRGEIRAAPKER